MDALAIMNVGTGRFQLVLNEQGVALDFVQDENVLQAFADYMAAGFDELVIRKYDLFVDPPEDEILDAMFDTSSRLLYGDAEVYAVAAEDELVGLLSEITSAGEALIEFLAAL